MGAENGMDSLLMMTIQDTEGALERCTRMLGSEDYSTRLKAIKALVQIDDRRVNSILMNLLHKDGIDPSYFIIGALAERNESNSLFPLINYANSVSNPTVVQKVLMYMEHTKDPRAQEFLEDYIDDSSRPFQDAAVRALEACSGNSDFLYTFAGNDSLYQNSLKATGQVLVGSDELDKAKDILGEDQKYKHFKPQTFVVDADGKMFIGGYLNEHVDVAKGGKVLAAGEVEFKKVGGLWQTTYINNRSNGYHSADSSFRWVQEFMSRSNVGFSKKAFDEVFPRDGFNNPEFLSTFRFGSEYRRS